MISHPFMTLAQPGDPPRFPSVQQYDTFVEPNVPQQLVAAAALEEVDIDVYRPRHVVVIYFFRILCLLFSFLCLLFFTNNFYVFFFT